jgi:hypothetical protein
MGRRKTPNLIVVGVGASSHEVLKRLNPDICRRLWWVQLWTIGGCIGVSANPPERAPEDQAPYEPRACWEQSVPVFRIGRLLRSIDLAIVVGGLDDLTGHVLHNVAKKVRTLLVCVTHRPEEAAAKRYQRKALKRLKRVAQTVIHIPIEPLPGEDFHDDQVVLDPSTARLIAHGVDGLCAPLVIRRPEFPKIPRGLFAKGDFGGIAVTSARRPDGIQDALDRLLFRESLWGGYSPPSARRLWLCIEGGQSLPEGIAAKCVEHLELGGLPREVAATTTVHVVRHEWPHGTIRLTLVACGFRKPSKYPSAIPPPWKKPERRATELLARLLPEQAARYREHGFIEVRGSLNDKFLYRIHNSGTPFATEILRNGKPLARTCVQFKARGFPPTDRVLAEYMMIRGDESAYLAAACLDFGDRGVVLDDLDRDEEESLALSTANQSTERSFEHAGPSDE